MGQADPIFIIIVSIMPVVMGLVIWFAWKEGKKTRTKLRALADEMGLGFIAPPPLFGIFHSSPRLFGQVQGREVEIYQYTTGSGKNSRTWSALKLGHVGTSRLAITLSGQGLGSKIRSVFGAEEIQVEDRHFNNRWFIETNDPDFLTVALFGKACAAIDASQSAVGKPKGTFELKDGDVFYREQGALSSDARIARIRQALPAAQALLDIADVHASQSPNA
ncbi:MAG: hypothetical protein SynsKO_18400 [Synoicihabitans sp.]